MKVPRDGIVSPTKTVFRCFIPACMARAAIKTSGTKTSLLRNFTPIAIIPAVIEIEGASKGMGIMHLLGEVDPDEVKMGMKVKAVWKPAEEREGAITDILYFKPVE